MVFIYIAKIDVDPVRAQAGYEEENDEVKMERDAFSWNGAGIAQGQVQISPFQILFCFNDVDVDVDRLKSLFDHHLVLVTLKFQFYFFKSNFIFFWCF